MSPFASRDPGGAWATRVIGVTGARSMPGTPGAAPDPGYGADAGSGAGYGADPGAAYGGEPVPGAPGTWPRRSGANTSKGCVPGPGSAG